MTTRMKRATPHPWRGGGGASGFQTLQLETLLSLRAACHFHFLANKHFLILPCWRFLLLNSFNTTEDKNLCWLSTTHLCIISWWPVWRFLYFAMFPSPFQGLYEYCQIRRKCLGLDHDHPALQWTSSPRGSPSHGLGMAEFPVWLILHLFLPAFLPGSNRTSPELILVI
jgi:hypothetical protein